MFSRLGFTSFGGPAVHIAMFEDEIVSKRKWMSKEHFLDLVGATNLIPGPNSTEMAMHTGFHLAGKWGLFTAGLSFLLPAVFITGVISFFYSIYGTIPDFHPFLYGIKPAVIIIILNAVYNLGRKGIKGWKLLFVAMSAAALNWAGLNEVYSIIAGGIAGSLFIHLTVKGFHLNSIIPLPLILMYSFYNAAEYGRDIIIKLFLVSIKIGTVWFGGGYILAAYFDGEFVKGLNWITRQELLDAIAIGQFTPGPVLSSATFIGYQIAGFWGGVAATAGIILPSFLFVLLLNPLIPKMRKSKFFSIFLDSVNASAIAVMLVAGLRMGIDIAVDWKTILIMGVAAAAFYIIKKINAAYIILIGAVTGYFLTLLK